MTRLFQTLADADISCDASNDDLHDAAHGVAWSVPVVKPSVSQLVTLVQRAIFHLGHVFRGFELRQLAGDDEFTHELTLFLTSEYED